MPSSVLVAAVDLGVDDRRAVEDHGDVIAAGDDFFVIPLADRLLVPGLGRHDAVDRAVRLPGLDLAILVGRVVENLNLHADIGRIALERRANADAVVAAAGQLEIEAERKIGVLALGVQFSAAILAARPASRPRPCSPWCRRSSRTDPGR